MVDSIKRGVAHKVASLVKDTNWSVVQGISVVDDRVNEASYVSDLETMIRIWTRYGPRYFVVKVREQH